ncbi:EAL domain-containing protein [Shigella sonnei]|nr:EAL domain-containing protein [Shigella sonnei]
MNPLSRKLFSAENAGLFCFFIATLFAGCALGYLQLRTTHQDSVSEDIQQLIRATDITLSHAEKAGKLVQKSPRNDCDTDTQIRLRKLVATIPDVRTISLVRNNEIYCSSVYGSHSAGLEERTYPNYSLTLLKNNALSPSSSLLVFSFSAGESLKVLVGIDAYYLYTPLKMMSSSADFYFRAGGRYLDKNGQVTDSLVLPDALQQRSEKYEYSVLAKDNITSVLTQAVIYGKYSIVFIFSVSVALTLLLKNVLRYHRTLDFMLRTSISRKELTPYIQPIIDIRSGSVVGGEVLMRWHHKKSGFISPDTFIPLAEQTGLINKLTELSFNAVIRSLQKGETAQATEKFICFNVGAGDFKDENLISLCHKFIDALPGFNLVLEITERVYIEKTPEFDRIISEIRGLGVRFSLDDFGTGHANYTYINHFAPEFLKIDKSFTTHIVSDKTSDKVVRNMIDLASDFDCCVIAEGIEDVKQLTMLKNMGIHFAQGYYFYRPMIIEHFNRIISAKVP